MCAEKFYDSNANGVRDNGEVALSGWQMTLSGAASATLTTGANGQACFTELTPGTYTVTESAPAQTNWLATTPTSQVVIIDANCPGPVSFGNVCLGAGGGRTLGFWSNQNGQQYMTGSRTGNTLLGGVQILLRGLNLRNANLKG